MTVFSRQALRGYKPDHVPMLRCQAVVRRCRTITEIIFVGNTAGKSQQVGFAKGIGPWSGGISRYLHQPARSSQPFRRND